MPAGAAFHTLSAQERHSIDSWRIRAAERGLDAVDLIARNWKVRGARAIIGIFRAGEPRAAWLLGRGDGAWVVIDFETKTVIGLAPGLDDALALVVP
ncbi:MAG TPA: hypothetical protein VHB27_01680 [Rhodopila sp.]|uniref:hypothetical protein n=1 Tax=Rhodopila sp. TaxID=2480087 RepID=UPI002D06D052|nr:hypothetical protein [Rhodopila sp.]HVY13909.1 hypothetical protein [Rhodopila sp.]